MTAFIVTSRRQICPNSSRKQIMGTTLACVFLILIVVLWDDQAKAWERTGDNHSGSVAVPTVISNFFRSSSAAPGQAASLKILRQPRWSLWILEEIYQLDFPSDWSPNPLGEILRFYYRGGVSNLQIRPAEVRFIRGSLLGSLFSWRELDHKQDVRIRIVQKGLETSVVCNFRCLEPFPNLHMKPRYLQRDVERLGQSLAPAHGGSFTS